MAKICQQILLTESNFTWLIEEKIGRKHKNLSQTVNELIRNYQYLLRAIDKANKMEESRIQREKEANEAINKYRDQIISKENNKNDIDTNQRKKK